MTQNSSSFIWKRLLIEQNKMVTTEQGQHIAVILGKNKKRAAYYPSGRRIPS